MALLAYYEFTGDKDVLETAEKAAKLIMEHYKTENYFSVNSQGGGISHGIGFFENLEWLYRITGNKEYLDFSVILYEDFNNGKIRDDDLKTQNLLKEDKLFENHGAHIAEGLFVPEFIASIQNEKKLVEAANNVIRKLKVHLTPGGAMRCDEWIKGREGSADERYEYCGITEMISPLNKMISFTGNLNLANRIETMVFNAGQGARFPVLSAVSYLTSDNRIRIKQFELLKRESYDAAHFAAACCALNAGRLMPYYVEGMWMKTIGDDGIVGNNLMTDHLHPTLEGYQIVGRLFFDKMLSEKYLPMASKVAERTSEQDAHVVANYDFTNLDTTIARYRIVILKNDWPFVNNLSSVQNVLNKLNVKSYSDSLALMVLENKIPWEKAHRNLANRFLIQGDIQKYLKEIFIPFIWN